MYHDIFLWNRFVSNLMLLTNPPQPRTLTVLAIQVVLKGGV